MATRRSTRRRRAPKRLEKENFLPGANNGYCAGREMDFGRDIDDFTTDTRFGTGFYDNSARRQVERRRRQEWMETTALGDEPSSEEECDFSDSDGEEDDWEALQEQEEAEQDDTTVEEDWKAVAETRERARLQNVEQQTRETHQTMLSSIPIAAASMGKKIRRKSRRVSWGDVTIHWKSGEVDGAATKEHDGISSGKDAFTTFLSRILAQTGEPGQGFLNKKWHCSWSPQVAWVAVPDQHKKEVARLLIDFFDRFSAIRAGTIAKMEDVGRGPEAEMKVVPRKKVQILSGGGSDVALQAQNRDHWMWVEKIKNSVTAQAILRNSANIH
jgi:hypothetical protein